MAERERRTQELLRSSEASAMAKRKAARSAWSIGLNKVRSCTRIWEGAWAGPLGAADAGLNLNTVVATVVF